MSDAEEIRRFAELRDKGLITTAEYSKQKQRILKGKRPWWRTALLSVLAAAGLVMLLSVAVAIFAPVLRKSLAVGVACDTPEVKQKVFEIGVDGLKMLERAAVLTGRPVPSEKLVALGDTTEIYRDDEVGLIVCLGVTQTSIGEGQVGYRLTDVNQETGQFMVEVMNPVELKQLYVGE